jgi:hypothetical protein
MLARKSKSNWTSGCPADVALSKLMCTDTRKSTILRRYMLNTPNSSNIHWWFSKSIIWIVKRRIRLSENVSIHNNMTYALVLLATAVPKSSKWKSQSLASAILKDSYSNSSTLHNDEEDDDNSEQESDSIENSVYCVYDNFDETEGKNMVSIMLLLPSGLLLPTYNLKYKINDSFYHTRGPWTPKLLSRWCKANMPQCASRLQNLQVMLWRGRAVLAHSFHGWEWT